MTTHSEEIEAKPTRNEQNVAERLPQVASLHGDTTTEPQRVIVASARRPLVRPRPRASQRTVQLEQAFVKEAEQLVDALVAYLSALPSQSDGDDDEDDLGVHEQASSSLSSHSGITLPASAIGWLTTRVSLNGINNLQRIEGSLLTTTATAISEEDVSTWTCQSRRMQEQLNLLAELLPRVTCLRITNADWPSGNLFRRCINAHETDTSDPHHTLLIQYLQSIRQRPQVDLSLFRNCKVLLLDQVPPEWIFNLGALRKSLQVLRIERCCIYDLPALFRQPQQSTTRRDKNDDPNHDNAKAVFRFSRLTHIKLAHCELNDDSGLYSRQQRQSQQQLHSQSHSPLARMMHLTSVSLAHNHLSSQRSIVAGLTNKLFLTSLDLSFNRLRSAKLLAAQLRNLTTLNLSHNQLTHTHGLDQLTCLQTLQIDHNRIADVAHMANVARLPTLQRLDIGGNPFERARPRGVRVDVLDLFREQRQSRLGRGASFRQLQQVLPLLDGRLATLGELKAIRDRTFRRTETIVFAVAEDSWVRVERLADVSDGAKATTSQRESRLQRRQRPRRRARIEASCCEAEANLVAVHEFRLDPAYQPLLSFTLDDVLTALSPEAATMEVEADAFNTDPAKDELVQDISSSAMVIYATAPASDDALESDQQEGTETPPDCGSADGGGSPIDPSAHKENTIPAQQSPLESQMDHENIDVTGDQGVDDNQVCSHDTANEWLPSSQENAVSIEAAFDFSMLSPIKPASYEAEVLKASASTTASTADAVEEPQSTSASNEPAGEQCEAELSEIASSERHRAFSPSGQESDHSSSQPSQSPFQQNFRHVASFGGLINDESLNVSLGSPKAERNDAATKQNDLQLAEANSVYEGPKVYAAIIILENLDLYFQSYVFGGRGTNTAGSFSVIAEQFPKIQLWSIDRRYREGVKEKALLAGKITLQEEFRRVWQEKVIACGHPALRRLTPNRAARYGFHGELLWSAANTTHLKPETIAENRDVIVCLTDMSLYIILDHDSVTEKTKDQKRAFPLPIPRDATFDKAAWPHALAFHPLQTLKSISIGFGFQRLTLRFANTTFPVPDDFSYVLLTSSKSKTISLLKEIQSLANDAKAAAALAITDCEVIIDNDDRHVLDGLGAAVAPDQIGSVIHYQILSQRWKKGDRGIVRRVCVVTDSKLYLLDEDYVGDGSESIECGPGQTLGDTMYRMVDSADLQQVTTIQAADADPVAITISIDPLNRLARTHNWRLVCRDRSGAERLVEDLRKAIAIAV